MLLLIEVADTTLAYDRGTKLALYAKSGIGETWIVNAQQECVEVYRAPSAGGYAERIDAQLGDRLSPQALPAISVAIAEVFA